MKKTKTRITVTGETHKDKRTAPVPFKHYVNLYIFTNNGQTMTKTNDRPDPSLEWAPDINKTVNANQ
jgi:hypothetical protein